MYLHLAPPALFHEALSLEPQPQPGFGPSYGNRLATARLLRERWQETAGEVALAFAEAAYNAPALRASGRPQ